MKGFFVKFAVLLYAIPTMLETVSISPTIDGIARAFPDLPLSWASAIGTISCLTIVVGSLASGYLTTKVKKKPLIIVGTVLWMVGGIGCAFMDNIWLIYAMRLIGGLGAGFVIAVSSMLIPELWPDEKETNRMMGLFGVSTAVWGTVMTYVVGLLVEHVSWQAGFGMFLIGIPMLALQLAFIPDVEIRHTEQAAESKKKVKVGAKVYMLLGSGAVYAILTTTFFVYSVTLFSEIGLGGADAGSLNMSIETIASFVAGLVLVQTYGKFKNLLPGLCWIIMAVASVLMVFATNVAMMYVGAFVFGLGYGTFYPYLYARGAKISTPETNDRTMAFVNVGYFVGYVIATPYIGFVATAFNNDTAFFAFQFMIGACAIAGVLYILKAIQERIAAKKAGEEVI